MFLDYERAPHDAGLLLVIRALESSTIAGGKKSTIEKPNTLDMQQVFKSRYYYIIVVGILLLCAGMIFSIENRKRTELSAAQSHYVMESKTHTQLIARNLENAFGQIYRNIRTISYLPGVRKIDRHATNLMGDAKETIQHVYNNLASTVSVSELYITPLDFDPEKIDPITGNLEEPIIMFDEVIVGRSGDDKGDNHVDVQLDPLEEIETYEYHLLAEQLLWLRGKFPDISNFPVLSVPAVIGPEVITCDNSRYSREKTT